MYRFALTLFLGALLVGCRATTAGAVGQAGEQPDFNLPISHLSAKREAACAHAVSQGCIQASIMLAWRCGERFGTSQSAHPMDCQPPNEIPEGTIAAETAKCLATPLSTFDRLCVTILENAAWRCGANVAAPGPGQPAAYCEPVFHHFGE